MILKKVSSCGVSGKAGQVHDKALLQEIIQARPFLQPYADKAEQLIAVFRVSDCAFNEWTFAKNNVPTVFEPF
jgi:hypothetical protein